MNEWLIGLCKQPGLSHIKDGKTCQDHIEYGVNDTQTCMATVLADGLGSRENSEWAARAATKAAMIWLMNNSEWLCEDSNAVEVIQNELLEKVRKSVSETAAEMGLEVNTMDCNLAFLCIQLPFQKAICGHLGDCAVCILDDKPRVLTAQGGSAIGTNTVMTARPDDICVQIVDLTENTNGFILTSDGLDGEIYRKNSTFVQHAAKHYFNTVFAADRETALEQKILELQNTKGDRFDDDISIVVACRAKAPIDLPKDPQWLCRCLARNSLTNSYCSACHADFLSLYPSSFTNRFTGLEDAILYLNAHPQEEQALLGLPVRSAPKLGKEAAENDKKGDGRQKPKGNKPQNPTEVNVAQREKKPPLSAEERANMLHSNLPGGSSAFVQQQAQQLQEENKSEESNDSRTTIRTGGITGTSVQRGDVRMSRLDGFLNRWELPILIAAMLLIAVALVISRTSSWPSGERPSGTSPSTHQTDVFDSQPTDPQKPENYVGSTKDGVPNGNGVLYKDGYFWVGRFVDGKMDGVFQKIWAEDTSIIEQVEFRMGAEEIETEPPTHPVQSQISYVLTRDIDRLYLDEALQTSIIVELHEGDAVRLDDQEPLEINGAVWGWIHTPQGNGWCKMDNLRLVEESEN